MAKYAFFVGINTYPGCSLNGCIDDINDLAPKVVQYRDFDPESIRLLTDDRATTTEIVNRLNWLVNVAQPGDTVLYWESGHGAIVSTRNTQGNIDDIVNCFCPVDFDWTPTHMVTDKVFNKIFSRFKPGVKFFWGSDSCHSERLDRELPQNPHPTKARAYPIPADIAWRNAAAESKGFVATNLRNIVNDQLEVGFVSACQIKQTAADAYIDGRYNGAFTYFFLQTWDKYKKDSVSLRKITEETTAALQSAGYDQEPCLDGALVDSPFLM